MITPWMVGHQPTELGADNEPGFEQEVGDWYTAVNLLAQLMEDWARVDDRKRVDPEPGWGEGNFAHSSQWATRTAWEKNPPIFDADAQFDIEGALGTRRFYLTGQRP